MPLEEEILAKIRNSDPYLTLLNLSDKGLGNLHGTAGANDVCAALQRNTTVTALSLARNLLGGCEAGARDLSDVLQHNTTLTVLDLTDNLLGDVGAKDISDALRRNANLTVLSLSDNKISAAGAIAISDALQHNTTLTSLDLSDNTIDDLTQVTSLTARNSQWMLARRQQFILKMIMLARITKNPKPNSLWTYLPKEVRLHILNFLKIQNMAYIGKTAEQIEQCIKFIFENIDKCNELVKANVEIKLLEKQDARGHYQFQFFKSNNSLTKVMPPQSTAEAKMLLIPKK